MKLFNEILKIVFRKNIFIYLILFFLNFSVSFLFNEKTKQKYLKENQINKIFKIN